MPTRTLTVGAGAARFNWLPVFAAERLGRFAAEGLAIEVVRTGAVDRATAAVLAGELDIAITPPEGAIRDAIAGGPLRLVAGNTGTLPLTLVARPGLRTVESLRGARLGTSSLTEGTALYTMEMLRAHGLRYPEDYRFEVVGVHPARWRALQDGRIDAAVQPAPFNLLAIEAGYEDLGEVSDYIPQIVFTAVVVEAGRAAAREEELLAFLRAVRAGTEAVYDGEHDGLLADILEELGESDREHARRAVDYLRAKRSFPRDLGIPEAAFATSVRLMVAAGLLDEAAARRAGQALDLRLLARLDEPGGSR